ncbi:MAG: hypothetical protein KJ737_15865 [Proteobacteria bacterium]|nr:hypothetical protein [Pseudomonadota bacterium]
MNLFEKSKTVIKRKVESILGKRGYLILKHNRSDLPYRQIGRIYDLIVKTNCFDKMVGACQDSDMNGVEGIIFSKDRPMQLDALLNSYFDLVRNCSPLHILYKCSTEGFSRAYDSLKVKYKSHQVKFHQENRFREDLLSLLNQINTKKVFFLVDDILFINEFDMSFVNDFDPEKYVFSLRMGKNITYSFMLNRKIKAPSLTEALQSEPHIYWEWNEGMSYWGYPLSVDGHVFSRKEVVFMISVSDFNAPNSLEIALQSFKYAFASRYGVSFPVSKIVNIPLNRVQQEYQNKATGYSEIELLKLWEKGYRFDYKKLYNTISHSPHESLPIGFINISK